MFYYILYGLIWMVGWLPLRVLYFLSDLNYYFIYYIIRYRRPIVRTNLERAFPEKEQQEIIKIEKRYYRHFCDLFAEMYRMWHMSPEEIRRRCVFVNPEVIHKYHQAGKSVIGVLGHYGNWEWMASFSLWEVPGVDFLVLYKPLHARILDQMMLHIRSRFGAVPVPKNDVLRQMVKNKQAGRPFLAGFIGDQTPNRQNLNFWMKFLNQETPVLVGTERIARKFHLAVISLRMRQVKRGYYEVEFVDLCEDAATLPPDELTVRHTRMLEEYIRETPELWLWSHKRWKHSRNPENQEQRLRDE